jgi:hypothetical protein
MKPTRLLGLLAILAAGCGSSSYSYESAPSSTGDTIVTAGGTSAPAAPAADYAVAEEAADYGGAAGGDWDDSYFEEEEAPAMERSVSDVIDETRPRIAQNAPPPPQQAQQAQGGEGEPAEASDGIDLSGPLLIYTARFHLGVYEVTETQDAILEQLAELDIILARRSDTELVIRVPAANFQRAVDGVEGAGDVLHREVNVQDVGEEFRDIAIRLRNAEVMRDRLERLLARADEVEDALAIERELQRLTDIIERFKGRQRYLSDQIRFSTITIVFQPLSTEPTGPDGFTLPFDWLEQLGLSNLMRLR